MSGEELDQKFSESYRNKHEKVLKSLKNKRKKKKVRHSKLFLREARKKS